jgi:PAS domain S-box-containing protein
MAFNHNSKFSEIHMAWEKAVSSGEIERNIVRPEIAQSWIRCYKAGVDPGYNGIKRRFLSPVAMEQTLAEHQELIEVSRPFMKHLYSLVAGSGFIVILSDQDANLLESLGDPETMEIAERNDLVKGANWAEEEAGTNGIGIALVERKPVQVSGPEHYCKGLHFWTCSAAPIFDEDHQIIGALQLSGPAENAFIHTLGMVATSVNVIEEELQLRKKNNELVCMNNHLNFIMEYIKDGILIVDRDGIITQANPAACQLFNLSPRELQGSSIKELTGSAQATMEMITSGKAYNDMEIMFEGRNGNMHLLASGKAIYDNNGDINGGIIYVEPMKNVKSLVNRFSGAQARFSFDDIIGVNRELQEAINIATLAAGNDSNVLIIGESGTGKEVFAQAIHNQSSRRNGPFVAVNCGAIPRELISSELFGYVEGAFTGAHRRGRPGKFELASGGTLFLDEIGDMPFEQQVALLRVLQEKKIVRIGGQSVVPVDVRIICATNKDLLKEVERGNFRQDLYYRLNVFSVSLPPLRNRQEDISLFLDYFLERWAAKDGVPRKQVEPDVVLYLQQYHWPGNIRELQNVMERMVGLCSGDIIGIDNLPPEILAPTPPPALIPDKPVAVTTLREKRKDVLAERERQEIINLLSKYGGNISRVARAMEISRNTVYRKIKQYNINL